MKLKNKTFFLAFLSQVFKFFLFFFLDFEKRDVNIFSFVLYILLFDFNVFRTH